MKTSFLRQIRQLDIGERMLNAAAIISIVGVLLPWISGEWIGGEFISYSGLQFYTAYIGWSVLLLNCGILAIIFIPLATNSYQVPQKDLLRLFAAALGSILILAALSVLTKFTFEFSRLEVRFGIYIALFGSLFVTFESFCKWKEEPMEITQLPPIVLKKRDEQTFIPREPTLPPPPPPSAEKHPTHPPHFSKHL
ncbi:hypothetical protein COU77_03245 [Candidatus Peregrinibacteria bacterium CG10_big_fil_rev_8_21_14_0_10_49_16]|nr:MAG: hypothetical protein COW95_02040 [Candidatus Peregrinibacteria bacterium CG22_combo_CG10-13_8_21_14_all_49_11]PIR51904.1 MAG: hypothetical protein COU77_03245 [Candidatus Peregrinibacteria bacterium CG10_big_fil_rev_8_21_14_0_10_49_16]